MQRDIFIFHCCIGCRISDLMRLTPANIINGYVEYIASKTKADRSDVIRVPLTQRAKDILEKYKDVEKDGKILPFISSQKYNVAIKKIFKTCGITRIVTVLNPTTGEEEQRPIDEIASSHLARRTFVGNLYKKVKDPNLVGALSGHKEGSRAFARYREIDDDLKKEMIGFIE
ncbi:MAG: site-specific integrase [Paraprevotella sp.]|nr:site-specific integrase [Paraprevotella sp.]